MTWGLSENRRRRRGDRGQMLRAVSKWTALAAAFALALLYAYQVGSELTRQSRDALEAENNRLKTEIAAARQEVAAATERLAEAEQQAESLRARYRADVPQDREADILRQVRARIEAGVPASRIGQMVAAIPRDERCDNAPESRRFALATAEFPNIGGAGRFAGGAITVTGTGKSARDEAGRLQAWFDAAAPVTLRFTKLNGETREISGQLPLFHSVVVGDRAYKFGASAGARSFIELSADRCAYP